MHALEKALDDLFKKAPQLSESTRKSLASALPWLTLLGGVMSLFAAWGIYSIVASVSQYTAFGYTDSQVANSLAQIWIGLAILVVQAVLFLVAFPALRTAKKSGWNLLFYAALANVVFNVVYNVVNFGQLILSLIGSALALYLLLQVRGHFGGASAPAAQPKAPTEADKKQ